jgi:two-component system chemotaxis response regulator CheY
VLGCTTVARVVAGVGRGGRLKPGAASDEKVERGLPTRSPKDSKHLEHPMPAVDSPPPERDLIRSEIRDKVTELEGQFLALEQALHDGKAPLEALHLILRHAHSLKGALGLAEQPAAAACVHTMETAFVAAREGRLAVSKEFLDLVFATLDQLTASAEQGRDDLSALEGLVTRWTEVAKASRSTSGLVGIPFPLSPAEAGALRDALATANQHLYVVHKSIYGDSSRDDYDRLPIYEDIAKLGVLIARHPRFDELDRKSHEVALLLLIASALETEPLKGELFDPFTAVSLSESDHQTYLGPARVAKPLPEPAGFRALIVEDDFTSRLILQKFLTPFGESHIAVDGEEALVAIKLALANDVPYDLICLDIMMPKLDGQGVLRELRRIEEENGRPVGKGAKVIMTTCLKDSHNIMSAFQEQCDAYLVKPIARAKLLDQLRRIGLLAA